MLPTDCYRDEGIRTASPRSQHQPRCDQQYVCDPLHDRLGETQCIDALTGEHKVTSLWLCNEGGHNRARGT